ncbi:uncharacterized protein LOC130501630 [Raphanus sativus]|uniref:Uncharacterized protein LOC108850382 n=1 Tax=Raphanus sativus TaxID=3726 RepID=A0A6J0N5S4_RAPSA|nr:uncharacterized protein LOC108850382 [Raphanus sativus]XP_056852451.1 uncharacterized protein LOC130501630 [Raphanus sativus]
MADVLSRAWAQVRWEEDVVSRAKVSSKYDQKSSRPSKDEREETIRPRPSRESTNQSRGRYQHRPLPRSKGMMVSTWPSISHLAISKPELIRVLRQMGPQVKWPPKMRSPDATRNPKRWCGFHSDHGHTTEDCIALRLEVAELLKKGYLREFLSDKAKDLLNREGPALPNDAVPALPPPQERVIHVISGGSEVSGISSAAAKRSTRNARNGQETEVPKHPLLETDEISFTAREQERVLAPHHDALVISLVIANCLVKRILVDNGSSSNIIFHSAYMDLGLDPKTLTRKATPLVGFSGEVKQTEGEVLLPVYTEGINQTTKFLVVDCPSSYNVILGRPWIHDMGAVPSTLHQLVKFPTPWGVKVIRGDQENSRSCYQTTL